jgi:hypothetical protein
MVQAQGPQGRIEEAPGDAGMSVVIETLVFCDDCGQNNTADDRSLNARMIRAARKKWGWIQVGSKDYCGECAPKHKIKHAKV